MLREVERRTRILQRFAACFTDHRAANRIEHSVPELVAQRVCALALGYEDLNDHDQLRVDPSLAVLADKRDPQGQDRKQERDRGKALAGKSTLNRLELNGNQMDERERYHKIAMDTAAIDRLLMDVFLEAHAAVPEEIVLDLDATDDLLYGKQEGVFFHGYYGHYCYLPLYIFCGEHLLCTATTTEYRCFGGQFRGSGADCLIRSSALARGAHYLCADSGFCRDELMSWCEAQQVHYVFGLARNQRLRKIIDAEMAEARAVQEQTQQTEVTFV